MSRSQARLRAAGLASLLIRRGADSPRQVPPPQGPSQHSESVTRSSPRGPNRGAWSPRYEE